MCRSLARTPADTPGRYRHRRQHVAQLGDRFLWGDAGRRILAGDDEGALTGIRIGAILHPGGLLALADGAGLKEHRDRPSLCCNDSISA
jgi:hypothetical protein